METWLNAFFGRLDEGQVYLTYVKLPVGDIIVKYLERHPDQIILLYYRCLGYLPFKSDMEYHIGDLVGSCPS